MLVVGPEAIATHLLHGSEIPAKHYIATATALVSRGARAVIFGRFILLIIL